MITCLRNQSKACLSNHQLHWFHMNNKKEYLNKAYLMADFLEIEKLSQTKFKTTSSYFADESRSEGLYRGKPRPFCLPRAFAEENLFPDIRQSAVSFFNRHGI